VLIIINIYLNVIFLVSSFKFEVYDIMLCDVPYNYSHISFYYSRNNNKNRKKRKIKLKKIDKNKRKSK